jgi:hypothetical protein
MGKFQPGHNRVPGQHCGNCVHGSRGLCRKTGGQYPNEQWCCQYQRQDPMAWRNRR